MRRELPADHAPRVDVDHEREEHHRFPAADVGEVRHVEPIGRRRGEVALDEVREPGSVRVRPRGHEGTAAALGTPDAVLAHQPLDAVTPDVDAGAPQRELHLAVAVGLEVLLVDLADHRHQLLIGDRPRRTPAGGALIVRRA